MSFTQGSVSSQETKVDHDQVDCTLRLGPLPTQINPTIQPNPVPPFPAPPLPVPVAVAPMPFTLLLPPPGPAEDMHKCYSCKANWSPAWRRGPSGENLCNACGLRWKRGLVRQTGTKG